MPIRRRINAPSVGRRTFLYGMAATAAVTPLAAWGMRQAPTLVEGQGVGPINAKLSTSPLADSITRLIDDAAVGTERIADALHPLRGFVKEISREEPFSQFALTWPGEAPLQLYARAEREDGSFGPWFHADAHSPMDGATGPSGTELLFVEPTRRIQVSTLGLNLISGLNPANIHGLDSLDLATLGTEFQNLLDGTAGIALNSVTAVFVDGNVQPGEVIQPVAYNSPIAGAPSVVTRAGWGADESKRGKEPYSYSTFLGTCIHHTAGSNNYTQAQVPGIIRGIYAYHGQTLGWGDVGYNAMVDKFGTIYEGRYGGLDKNIMGAHAGGFNNGTFGISVLGNHDQVQMSDAAIAAVGEMVGWRMRLGGVDPLATTKITSSGRSGRYGSGQVVSLPAIFGHRDTGYTSCPGNYGYQQMDAIRHAAKAKYDGALVVPVPESQDPSGTGTDAQTLAPQPGMPGGNDGTSTIPTENLEQFITELLQTPTAPEPYTPPA